MIAPQPAPAPQPPVVVVAKPDRPVGETVIRCTAAITGVVSKCEIASENPAGVGLGASALTLAARFHVEPPTRDGRPVEGTVLLPFKFQMAGDEKPPQAEHAPPGR